MKKISLASITLILIALFGPSEAAFRRGGVAPVAPTAFRKSLNNTEISPLGFVNILKNCAQSGNGVAAYGQFDANGWPTSGNARFGNCPMQSGVSYTLLVPATRTNGDGSAVFLSFDNTGFTGCSTVNGTASFCSGGLARFTQTTVGQAASMTFTAASDFGMLLSFDATGLGGTGELAVVRTSDIARFNSGEYLTAEVIQTHSGLYARLLRFMAWIDNGAANLNNEANWATRRTLNTAVWGFGAIYPPSLWAPTAATGTNAYTVAPAPSSPANWTDGEQIIVRIGNSTTFTTFSAEANNGSGAIRLTVASSSAFTTGQAVTVQSIVGSGPGAETFGGPKWIITVIDSTHIDLQNSVYDPASVAQNGFVNSNPTLTITGHTGSKPIIASSGEAGLGEWLQGSTCGSNSCSIYTMTYSARYDAVMAINEGITSSPPYEVMAHLTALAGSGGYFNIPMFATDDYVNNMLTLLKGTSLSEIFLEYCNEVWNFQFPQYGYARGIGRMLGFPDGNAEENLGWYALRTRQIMGNLVPAIFSGADAARMKRVHAYQAGGDSAILTYSLKGTDLVNNRTYAVPAITLTIGTPCLVTAGFSGYRVGWPVKFSTTGALPTGLTAGTTYYVSNIRDRSASNFYVAATAGGAPIACSGTQSGVHAVTYTNTFYNTQVGIAYNAIPNRPADVVEYFAYAPYTGASNFIYGQDTGQFGGNQASLQYSKPLFQSVVTNWEAGSTAAAITSIDNDVFPGTSDTQYAISSASGTTINTAVAHPFKVGSQVVAFSSGGTGYSGFTGVNKYRLYLVDSVPTSTSLTLRSYAVGFPNGPSVTPGTPSGTTSLQIIGGACAAYPGPCPGVPSNYSGTMAALVNIVNSYMQFGEDNAAQFDGDRPAGMANVKNVQYEAALEVWYPPSADVTALGLTGTNPINSLTAAVLGWLNDPKAATQQIRFFKTFMGTDTAFFNSGAMPHSDIPAQYSIYGPRSFSQSWAILSGIDGSTPYQLYNGIATYNTTP